MTTDKIREKLKDIVIQLKQEEAEALIDCLKDDMDYDENRGKSLGLSIAADMILKLVKDLEPPILRGSEAKE